jgi:ABC-2 type transport system permease protein
MTALLKSEFRKLRTTRTIYGFLAAVALFGAVTVIDSPPMQESLPWHRQQFVFFTSFMTRVLILVVGIRIATDEFRHGTIVPTLLATPNRIRVLVGKLGTAGATGLVLATTAAIAMVSVGAIVGALEGLSFNGEAVRVLGGFVLAGALWAVVGVAIGTLIRNQIIAIVGGLIWLMGVEEMLKPNLGDLADYLPGNAGLAMVIAPRWGLALSAASIFLSFSVLVSSASALAITRRDVD